MPDGPSKIRPLHNRTPEQVFIIVDKATRRNFGYSAFTALERLRAGDPKLSNSPISDALEAVAPEIDLMERRLRGRIKKKANPPLRLIE